MKSEIIWNYLPTLPPEYEMVLLLVYNDFYDETNVTAGCWDGEEFNDNPPEGVGSTFENVLAWAKYPTVGVVLVHQGKLQAYVSRPW